MGFEAAKKVLLQAHMNSTPLNNMKVSWDDDILNIWKVIKFMFQTTSEES
jgi:hypothetical protein